MSFEEYMKKYYAERLKLAAGIVETAFPELVHSDGKFAFTQAVFDKIASPLVYLKDEYKNEKEGEFYDKLRKERREQDTNPTKPAVQQKISKNQIVFPEPYSKLLDITENGNYMKIRAKEFISDKRDFREISNIVRQYGGEYVSAGKDSHWRIPKKEA